ncbi:hypothetical protein [Oceanobacter mangrovi]|uniref:hypothetical protein n=1 Tax=Oceanobacter mangrovi TaxID=2862510 RepID=UPI001C8E9715|nr:hypothetical protein [Oceanobacter mangrovi]
MQYLVCESNDLTISNSGNPQCSTWVAYTTPANDVQPDQLALAFGAGFAILVPIYAGLVGVKLAKRALFS